LFNGPGPFFQGLGLWRSNLTEGIAEGKRRDRGRVIDSQQLGDHASQRKAKDMDTRQV
jgi:hypothetical protein